MKEKFIISNSSSLRSVLEKLNKVELNSPVLFIENEKSQVIGSVSDGDIRRGLLGHLNLESSVEECMNTSFKHINEIDPERNKKCKSFKKSKINIVPVLNNDRKLVEIILLNKKRALIPAEGIIMAGGLGSRLKPLTENKPKPMIEVGGKPIIQYNFERLSKFGVSNIHVALGYMGKQISDHFNDGSDIECKLSYVKETKPLGTIGAVRLIKDINQDYVILMNSDLLTNIDYEDFFNVFKEREADIAVATIPYEVTIPFAVLEMKKDEFIKSFSEKPTYTYQSNGGIYLIKKELLKLVPEVGKFDATDFMTEVIKRGYKIISYAIRGYWLDIGKHEDLKKAKQDIKHINL